MAELTQDNITKDKKKFYQKWWFWALVIIVAIIALSPKDSANQPTGSTSNSNATVDTTPESKETEPTVPAEFKSALAQANSYANNMHMSKQGVYDQLVSEYGGKFKPEAAQYGIDNVKADWNKNALQKAKDYQGQQNLSPAAIRDQLVSAYGEKFTEAEADYAIAHIND